MSTATTKTAARRANSVQRPNCFAFRGASRNGSQYSTNIAKNRPTPSPYGFSGGTVFPTTYSNSRVNNTAAIEYLNVTSVNLVVFPFSVLSV